LRRLPAVSNNTTTSLLQSRRQNTQLRRANLPT
jgi:hypothetical protein